MNDRTRANPSSRIRLCLGLCAAVVASFAGGSAPRAASPPALPLRDVLGVTHVDNRYTFTEKDDLNEGADQILALGSRTIKVWFFHPESKYRTHSHWPAYHSLVELAKTPYYRELFRKPFRTFILLTYSLGRPEHYWRFGVKEEEKKDEQRQFHDLAKYLLTAYRGTGKTFVLQHWEGDWAVRGNFNEKEDPTPTALDGMALWLNARQAGVEQARQEVGETGAHVYHAAEVSLVGGAMDKGRPAVANRTLPKTHLDLVSYSSWDTEKDPARFRKALDFIAANAGASPTFGKHNVYVGEYGLPENDYSPNQVLATVRGVVDTGLQWGCPYIVYWQLYCNEARHEPVRTNQDVRGFWLIRPDGSHSPVWDYLRSRLRP